MATNTLTGLIPVIYAALNVVSREMIGFIPAVSRDSGAEQAALNQTISSPIVPAAITGDITPGINPVDDGAQVIDKVDMTISKSKYSPVQWGGEEVKSVNGIYDQVVVQQFAESFRVLTNLIEADLGALYTKFSRAYGTAGTTPFATAGVLSDLAQPIKILKDNGAPTSNWQTVLGTSAMANIGGVQSNLFKVNEAGTDDLLRRGAIARLLNTDLHDSGQAPSHTKGTGTAYTSSTAGFAIGVTDIALITGSGTVVAGDVVTFAGDTNKYLVTTGIAAPGTISIAKPGLRQAIAASAVAMTIGASYEANPVFSRSAVHLITRTPEMPEGGDSASDVMNVTDPVSGLVFQIALYKQYRRIKYEIGVAWGQQVVKPEHTSILLG